MVVVVPFVSVIEKNIIKSGIYRAPPPIPVGADIDTANDINNIPTIDNNDDITLLLLLSTNTTTLLLFDKNTNTTFLLDIVSITYLSLVY